jgi:hypothetical protein
MLFHRLDARMKGTDRERQILSEEVPETPERHTSAVYNIYVLVTA